MTLTPTRYRPLENTDVSELHKILNDFENQILVGGKIKPLSKPEVLNWLEKKREDSNVCQFAIEVKGNFCGYCQLVNIDTTNGHATLGLNLLREYQGMGVGTKTLTFLHQFAKTKLSLKKIVLYVRVDNLPAINLYKKNGYRTVGVLEKHIKTQTHYTSLKIMETIL